jgi:hypothetical protein
LVWAKNAPGGNSDNLAIPSQGRLLEKVDDFDFALRFEVLRTDFFKVADGSQRFCEYKERTASTATHWQLFQDLSFVR